MNMISTPSGKDTLHKNLIGQEIYKILTEQSSYVGAVMYLLVNI